MGFLIFRLIIFIGLLWLGIRLLRLYSRKQQQLQDQKMPSNRDSEDTSEQMVQCRFCNLHLPEKSAVRHESLWFCCHEHRDHFLAHGPEKK